MPLNKKVQKVEHDYAYPMAVFISGLVFGLGLFMLLLNFSHKNFRIIPITIAYTILMAVALVSLIKTKKLTVFYITAIFMIFMLEISFLLTGGTEGFGILWISLVPILSIYVLSFDYYIVLNVLVFLLLILGFWTPLSKFCYGYKTSFEIRYPILYFTGGIYGFFLKRRITIAEGTVEKQNEELRQELERAAIIQENFYNHVKVEYKGWDLAHVLRPMEEVTGDLYDIYDRSGNLDGIGVFDISGHGISSGLVTMLVKNIIQQEFYAGADESLSQVVELIDGRVIEEKGNIDNYLTGILIRIVGNNLQLVNAGHPYPLIYRKKTDSFEVLKKKSDSRGAIGFSDLSPVFVTQDVEMEKDDEIILFTDGIFDIENTEGKSFSMENMENILWEVVDLPAQEQVDSLVKKIDEFRGEREQTDDLTVMILKKD